MHTSRDCFADAIGADDTECSFHWINPNSNLKEFPNVNNVSAYYVRFRFPENPPIAGEADNFRVNGSEDSHK